MPNSQKKIHEIIRVDHAGEFGAKVIYAGQIAALKLKKDYETLAIVEEMKQQEDVHFDYFNEQIKKQKVRPTLMQPVWRVGGFALGFFTALLDKRAAMACTTAVEEVIDEHYQEQSFILDSTQPVILDSTQPVILDAQRRGSQEYDSRDPRNPTDFKDDGYDSRDPRNPTDFKDDGFEEELKTKIEKFRAEELEHRDIGYEHKADELSYFKPLTSFIKATTKFAIAVSKKI